MALRLLGSLVAFGVFPLYLACAVRHRARGRGVRLADVFLLSWFLSRTGRYDGAHGLRRWRSQGSS